MKGTILVLLFALGLLLIAVSPMLVDGAKEGVKATVERELPEVLWKQENE